MRWRTRFPPSSPLTALFPSLSSPKSLPEVSRIHQQLLVHGLLPPSDYFLSTKLLQIYADAGDLPSARLLFSALPHRTIFAWTPILAALCRSGHHTLSLSLYSRMRADGVPPDGYVLPVVLRSSSLHPSIPAALHADAIRFAVSSALHVINALISAYAAAGDHESARGVFAGAADRDLLSWNSIISVYTSTGCIDAALELLQSMRSDGFDPDIVTWNTVMDGYCRAGRCAVALEVLRRIPNPNVVSFTTVIVGLSRAGDHAGALDLFRSMVSRGLAAPDPDILSCVLSSVRHTPGHSSREIHGYGLKTLPSTAFYGASGAALVAAYGGVGRIVAAMRVFRQLDPDDVVSWNSVILALVHAGMGSLAVDLFTEMQARGTGSDGTTVATVLPACDRRRVKQIHAHVLRRNYDHATTLVFNALITAYSRSGCVFSARLVFATMDAERDVVTWNAMVSAYGSHGMGLEAVELVREMGRYEVRPNSVTITSAIAACSHCGMVAEGLELFEDSGREIGVAPKMELYACIVDLLSRAGRFEEAIGFIKRMLVRADASAWGALLAASKVHDEGMEFGRVAFEELVELEPQNAGNYVTMSGMYARAGRWEEAKTVRKMMDARGVVKPSGHSWVEGLETW